MTRTKSRQIFAVAVIVILATLFSARMTNARADTRTTNAPVLFVHGYLFNVCPGENTAKTFASAAAVLASKGYTGPVDMIDYYACDTNGSNIQTSGDPNAYYPGGAYTLNNTSTSNGGNTDNTDIRHISYQLAWYIYNRYSQGGQTVELVAHSMGGLIVRWALYQIQAHNPVFPPYLYVQDVVTISTPHDGVNDGYNNVSWCPSSTQCSELLPGNAFLAQLHQSGMNPQATGGTDWTAIGGSPCDTVNNPAGTTLDAGDVHKVAYIGKRGTTPVCYSHTSYLTDTSTKLDMPVKYRNPGDAGYVAGLNPSYAGYTTGLGAHSLAWMADAVMSGSK